MRLDSNVVGIHGFVVWFFFENLMWLMVLTVHHELGLGVDLPDRVVRFADVDALIILSHVLDDQTAVLFQNLGPADRNVTVFFLPQNLRVGIAPHGALELDPLANQDGNVRRFVDEVWFH